MLLRFRILGFQGEREMRSSKGCVKRQLTLPWCTLLVGLSPMRCVRYAYNMVQVYITVRWSQCRITTWFAAHRLFETLHSARPVVREPRSCDFRGYQGKFSRISRKTPKNLFSKTSQGADRASDLVKAHEDPPPRAIHLPGPRRFFRCSYPCIPDRDSPSVSFPFPYRGFSRWTPVYVENRAARAKTHCLRYGSRGANVLTATGPESFICQALVGRETERDQSGLSVGAWQQGACGRLGGLSFNKRRLRLWQV